MRIKSLELAWFRGAAVPVSLEANCKSMVVYGENGSGKSSFVDAVEYVLNNKSIEHLKTEYSGSRQVNAIPNTHKAKTDKTALKFKFEDDSEIKIDFGSDGSSRSSGAQKIAIDEWEYRQTVLRQNEVSEFIHDTKGKKYSALLPLFGLHKMELTAENLRKLAKTAEVETKLGEKRADVQQVRKQWDAVFSTQSYAQIVEGIDNLWKQYCKGSSTTSDALSRCNDLETAINNRFVECSADDRTHVLLKGIGELDLKERVDTVRKTSARLAGSLDPHITKKLTVIRSTNVFVDGLNDTEIVECPACGQTITVDAFREHIKEESRRLQEMNDAFDTYKGAIGSLCDTLNALKSNLGKSDLRAWREGVADAETVEGFKYMERVDLGAIRDSCGDDDLEAIETKLVAIVNTAERDSQNAPPDVQKLAADKKRLDVAKAIIVSEGLRAEIANSGALVAMMGSLEQGVRVEIRRQSQSIIDKISEDIESMWEILHPGQKIENVRLSLPEGTDKAIDVVLKFHGLDQESPRLTLSEGYRNSLGLCIFLAMAKRVVDMERPLFLDDVVVSLDRNHRGMVQELLEKEFNGRQVIILTHDREWYTELRHQLGANDTWLFKTLLPYESPGIGIRWSHRTTTFDDARALVAERPEAGGNDARRIMDVELSMIAEHLQIRLPYLRSDKNDRRVAHQFLARIIAEGRRCFQKGAEGGYVANNSAIDACAKADRLLLSWGNRASHSFDIVRQEANMLIDACENAIASFKCDLCDPPSNVWKLEEKQAQWLQCQCGDIRWRYGKA